MKTKFPRQEALRVAKQICDALKTSTERLIVAGSLRRKKAEVGDLEVLYIPKFGFLRDAGDLFATPKNLADAAIQKLESDYVLGRRQNVNGSEMFGVRNKLMVHKLSGIPVDLFEVTSENWFNQLVCRTGPAESNVKICQAAQKRGYKWKPYSAGFVRLVPGPLGPYVESEDEWEPVNAEQDVFEFVGMPYKEPWER